MLEHQRFVTIVYEVTSSFGISLVEAAHEGEALEIALTLVGHRAQPRVIGRAAPSRIDQFIRLYGQIECRFNPAPTLALPS